MAIGLVSHLDRTQGPRPSCSWSRENPGKSKDCGPSDRAPAPGQGCTSTTSPIGTQRRCRAGDMGAIRLGRPVPCDGSAITGRCVGSRASAIDARSSACFEFRVSKCFDPALAQYDIRIPAGHQVLSFRQQPLLDASRRTALQKRTGFPTLASRRSNAKFCMLRAPTCKRSACSQITSTSSVLITSVTTGRPVSLPRIAQQPQRFYAKPLKFVRRRTWLVSTTSRSNRAPPDFTARAVENSCSRDSTEHGPAMTTKVPSPICTPPTLTTVRCGFT